MKNTFFRVEVILDYIPMTCFLIFLLSGCSTTIQDVQQWKEEKNISELISVFKDREIARYCPTFNHNKDDFMVILETIKALSVIGEPAINDLVVFLKNKEYKYGHPYAVVALGKIGTTADKSIPLIQYCKDMPIAEISSYGGIDHMISFFFKQLEESNPRRIYDKYFYKGAHNWYSSFDELLFDSSLWALGKITGQHFNSNEDFIKWWEENKYRYETK